MRFRLVSKSSTLDHLRSPSETTRRNRRLRCVVSDGDRYSLLRTCYRLVVLWTCYTG